MDRKVFWLVPLAAVAALVQVAVIRHLPTVRVAVEIGQPAVGRPVLAVPAAETPSGLAPLPDSWSPVVRRELAGKRCVVIDRTPDTGFETRFEVPPDLLPPEPPLRDAVMVPQWITPVPHVTSTEPGPVNVDLYLVHPGQWGWIPDAFLVPTSHGIVVDGQGSVRDRPFEGGTKVVVHADGVLHIYPNRRLQKRPLQEPPLVQEGSVQVHWIDK